MTKEKAKIVKKYLGILSKSDCFTPSESPYVIAASVIAMLEILEGRDLKKVDKDGINVGDVVYHLGTDTPGIVIGFKTIGEYVIVEIAECMTAPFVEYRYESQLFTDKEESRKALHAELRKLKGNKGRDRAEECRETAKRNGIVSPFADGIEKVSSHIDTHKVVGEFLLLRMGLYADGVCGEPTPAFLEGAKKALAVRDRYVGGNVMMVKTKTNQVDAKHPMYLEDVDFDPERGVSWVFYDLDKAV